MRFEKFNDVKVLRMPSREFVFSVFKSVKPAEYNAFIVDQTNKNKNRIKEKRTDEIEIADEFIEKADEYECIH